MKRLIWYAFFLSCILLPSLQNLKEFFGDHPFKLNIVSFDPPARPLKSYFFFMPPPPLKSHQHPLPDKNERSLCEDLLCSVNKGLVLNTVCTQNAVFYIPRQRANGH